MSTCTARIDGGPVVRGFSLRAKGLLLASCTLMLLDSATPVRGQDANANETTTALDDRVHDSLVVLRDNAIELWLEHATLDPSFIEIGKTVNSDDLLRATWQRDYSVANLRLTDNLFWDAKADTFAARAVVTDLQSKMSQARYSLDFARYLASSTPLGVDDSLNLILATSERALNTQSQLAEARLSLVQASSYQNRMGLELASAKSDLRQAESAVSGAQRGVFYFSEVAPRVNVGLDFAAEHVPLVFIGRDALDLATNPVYRVQSGDAASNTVGLFLNIASYLLRDTFSGNHFLPGVGSFDQTVNGIRTTYKAFEHQDESVNLAFSGTLSRLNLNTLPRYTPAIDFHDHNGSFFEGAANGPLAVYSRWTSEDRITTDQFDTQSWYRFNGVETASGHVLTGSGSVVRERKERHDPFQFDAILNTLNVFNFNDSLNENETTRRYESYNDSFNGALANQSIQRAAEFNHRPNISLQVMPSATLFYDQANLKRPPSIFLPPPAPPRQIPNALYDQDSLKRPPSILLAPPLPPRPQPNALSKSEGEGGSPPQVKGVLMPATVVKSKPTDKADTSDVFGPDHRK